jgi:microsomal dipeptidase-like Zn-dependent dipeptidase
MNYQAKSQNFQEIRSMAGATRRMFMVVVIAALGFAASAIATSAKDLNGYYEGDDGGAYFIRQVGNKIYWFGEDPHGAWANVLAGTIDGTQIHGRFWDVPKGRTKGVGEITLTITSDGATLTKLSSTTPFGTRSMKKIVPHTEMINGIPQIVGVLPPVMRSRPQGFFEGEQSLTGAWQGDDSAFYYVRETPSEIVWVAENNQWGGPGGRAKPSFVHVFIGKKTNKTIVGEWVDLPKGEAKNQGRFAATLTSQQDMTVNPSLSGINATRLWRSLPDSLRGFADLHAHPMVNLGFGGKLVHGGLDVGSLLPTDSKCRDKVRATSIAEALGTDNSTHGGWGLDNPCGDDLRVAIIDAFQEKNHAIVTPDWASGYPSFKDWPKWDDITHQKMWVDWMRRSYDSGQRVMVALAVNNYTIAAGVAGPGDGPTDDKASADLQITEIKSFVSRHNDFMEVALTPADLRRIVAANKLAVILGVEIDNIGNFNKVGGSGPMTYDAIQHLYNEGVRYVFPIHLINNKFGGTAVYQDIFNLSNYHVNGEWFDLKCSVGSEGIKHRFVADGFDVMFAAAKATKLGIDIARNPPPTIDCGKGPYGHKNTLGLTPMGERAIYELMTRGMLIDVDHMSDKAVSETIDKAKKVPGGYPLVSGHNTLRNVAEDPSENNRTYRQLEELGKLGGMFGLGSDAAKAGEFIQTYHKASAGISDTVLGIGPGRVAFGTDLNGLVRGPEPPVMLDPTKPDLIKVNQQLNTCTQRIYDSSFVMSKTGDKEWNYCGSGVAHYGMLADFLKDIFTQRDGDYVQTQIMRNAEMFAQMWEKAIKNGGKNVPL